MDRRGPDDLTLSTEHACDVLADWVSVVGRLGDRGEGVSAEQQAVGTAHTRQPQRSECLRYSRRVIADLGRQLDHRVGSLRADPADAASGVAVEDGSVLDECDLFGGILNGLPVGVRSAAGNIVDSLPERKCSSTLTPLSISSPDALASSVLGVAPTPTTTRSPSIWLPSESRTPVARAESSPVIRATCTPQRRSTPWPRCRVANTSATSRPNTRSNGSSAASNTATSTPAISAAAATSKPIQPAPTITIRDTVMNAALSRSQSSTRRSMNTRLASAPGKGSMRGEAPVARSSFS
jgi:hypothetical protein